MTTSLEIAIGMMKLAGGLDGRSPQLTVIEADRVLELLLEAHAAQGAIAAEVRDAIREMARQQELKAGGKFDWTCADKGPTDAAKLAVLVEEVGEVAKELCDGFAKQGGVLKQSLYTELIQVAAVALSWASCVLEQKQEESGESVSEWKKGLPLSTYITIAVADARAALATGKYELFGGVWHKQNEISGKCGICLAGGRIARAAGFDPSLSCNYPQGSSLYEPWEVDVFKALDHVRVGEIQEAFGALGRPVLGGVLDTALEAINEKARQVFQAEDGDESEMAPLEEYEAAAAKLKELGL